MTRKDNNYKYFCTIDPATWETNPGYCSEDQLAGMQRGGEGDDSRWQEGERGSSGGGLRGEGGGGVQRGMDRGWEGVQTGTRAGGNRTHGSLQTEPTNNGNGQGQASGSKATVGDVGNRNYRAEKPKGKGKETLQTTLSDLWKDNNVTGRSWDEDIAWRKQESNKDRQLSTLSYV